jgi:ribosomal protein L24E
MHQVSFRFSRRAVSVMLWVACFASIAIADESRINVSLVGDHAMPTNIVRPGAQWNFGPGSLWTHRGWQYAAYWDDARQVSVARRQLPAGQWSVVSLPGYQRTANIDRGKGGKISQGFGDGHEKVSMGISSDGFIHLSFDHHLSTLRYRHSRHPVADSPQSTRWNAEVFGPVKDNLGQVRMLRNRRNRSRSPSYKIESVTYPNFIVADDALLLYLRLGGGSGSANSHLFNYQRGRWIVNQEFSSQFIDKNWSGGDGTVNAYPNGIVCHQGRLHTTWCWRDTPDPSTSHDLCYAYSDDYGISWRNSDGAIIAKTGRSYITADSPGVTVWKISAGKKYKNGGSMTVDNDGRVHVLSRDEDGSPTHFQRDPKTKKWSKHDSSQSGTILAGSDDALFIVSEQGLYLTSAKNFGSAKLIANGKPELMDDSRISVDRTRLAHDGWISVIGQQGKRVSVIDYFVGK